MKDHSQQCTLYNEQYPIFALILLGRGWLSLSMNFQSVVFDSNTR